MTYQVVYSREAVEDLERLFDHVLDRELRSPSGDLDIAARAITAVQQACQLLAHSPFSCRKAGASTFVRELIISFGGSGYVALFEIRDSQQVIIGAIRHQNESDYH
jgi:plasmid stabilization system protein ParE